MNDIFRLSALMLPLWLTAGCVLGKSPKNVPEPVLLVVMDPLAKELACACVKGYAQRDYRKLAARLEKAIKQRVNIEFSDDLAESMSGVSLAREVIVIGDQSLVANGAKKARLKCHPVCELTGPDGSTTLNASFIARSDDAANALKDIGGRKIFMGLAEADEKHRAALAALRAAGLEPPALAEQRASYSDAALDLVDSKLSPPAVAVIPGYALRLLEGCGSVKPGALKVLGKAQPVPFITGFVADTIPAEKQDKILQTMLGMNGDAKLLKAMESRDGFKPMKAQESTGPALHSLGEGGWPDWRGPDRDGHVPALPARLPGTAGFIWKKAAMNGGLAGLTISSERLILAERDFVEEHDVYRCLNGNNGELLWRVEFPARGKCG